jgi:hypothetical protein
MPKNCWLEKTFNFLCIGVSNGTEARELGRYPSGNTLPISSYANFNHRQGSPAYHASMSCLFTSNSYLDNILSTINLCHFSPLSWLFSLLLYLFYSKTLEVSFDALALLLEN